MRHRRAGILLISIISLLVLLGLNSCKEKWPTNFEEGFFPDSVMNFRDINTKYDDYNSAGPATIAFAFPFVFSSNRTTEGGTFDLIDYQVYVSFDQNAGNLAVGADDFAFPFNYLTELANTEYHEFGPYLYEFTSQEYLFCFASNRTGNMEIYASYFTDYTFAGMSPIEPNPNRIQGINSTKYDAYPTFTSDGSKIYFCSDRYGNLDIFEADLPEKSQDLYNWIFKKDTTYPVRPSELLNSDEADICPYINGNLMVFTSKRSGGYGGYDLYYTIFDGTEWASPVNFGSEINSAYDEYRPATFYASRFTNDLMIFSSNRPGGKGGYDLYYVGIDKMMQ